jgi:uncharacterized membrane protein YfcA
LKVYQIMLNSLELGIFAFVMSFMNDTLGGGYGTLSSPLLLIFGYPATVAVPSVLFSEAWSEGFSSYFHAKRYHNTNYRSFGLVTLGGIFGIIAAVYLVGVFLTSTDAKLCIGAIAVMMGIFVIVRSYSWFSKYTKEREKTNAPLTCILGILCGFNKSSTGGGYGPLSTSSFQLLGLTPAKAVGTTIPAKGLACVISTILWSGLVGMTWSIALPMAVGGIIGAPMAAWMNNYLKSKAAPSFHGRLLGLVMTLLGLYTILTLVRVL